jgi:hypothetical protein
LSAKGSTGEPPFGACWAASTGDRIERC